MLTRRAFLKASSGAAAGLFLPSWLVMAENFIESEAKPFLELPARQETTLHAIDWGFGEYQLALSDDPFEEPPELTWREFLDHYDIESFEDYVGSDDPEDFPALSLEDTVDEDALMGYWTRNGSPDAKAFDYLQWMDLGSELQGNDAIGEIQFYDGVHPGNDSKLVIIPDDLSLSLLQNRLNEMGEAVLIKPIGV